MKKIAILHISNIQNYGSTMMAINLMNYLNQKYQGVQFYVDNAQEEQIKSLKNQTGIENIHSIVEPKSKNKIDTIKSLNFIAKFVKKNKIDAVIVIGGDDISEYYGIKGLVLSTIKKYLVAKKVPVMLAGQTIGPFTDWRIPFMKQAIKPFIVISRDQDCNNYVKNALKHECFDSRDLAFISLPMQGTAGMEMVNKYQLANKKYITIVPSGLAKGYTDDWQQYINVQVNYISRLIEQGNHVVLLAHVICHSSDKVAIDAIMEQLTAGQKQSVTAITEEMTPLQARNILGNGEMTITGRMHAAVSTFQTGKPAISLSYSVKYAGVIGKGLDMSQLIIDSDIKDNKLKWTNDTITEEILEKVTYVRQNYINLQQKIQINVQKSADLATKSLDYIVENI